MYEQTHSKFIEADLQKSKILTDEWVFFFCFFFFFFSNSKKQQKQNKRQQQQQQQQQQNRSTGQNAYRETNT